MHTSYRATRHERGRSLLALFCVLFALGGTTAASVHAQGLPGGGGGGLLSQPRFLPVDEAFSHYTSLPEKGVVAVHWTIAPDYYLYREKFAFSLSTGPEAQHVPEVELPEGVAHHDEFFGDVEVYYGQVAARLQIPASMLSGPVLLVIEYQGCSELGLCYPPQRREIELNL